MELTNEQKKAVTMEGSNILVSAGAGSGKTAVLSQRVLRKVKEGIDIRQILILTFTKEAAKEMKNRIQKKIKEAGLKEQLEFIDSADITTFDAFSLNVVKTYHYLLNISQSISIIDSSIITLEKKRILNQIFEQYYNKKEPRFLKMIEEFTNKDDEQLKETILKINQSLDLKYDKLDYLNNYISNFYNEDYYAKIFQEYFAYLKDITIKIEENLYSLADSLDDKQYEKLSNAFKKILRPNNYQDLYLNKVSWPTLKNIDENAKKIKDELKAAKEEIDELTIYSEEELKKQYFSTKDNVSIIIDIILALDEKIWEYKINHNAFEFMDISKMAIKIVKEHADIRDEIKEKYQEIMIDEYQDTNDLQELFINEIANNNVYMVGDIKQSIYRFRNANPNIFKEKYERYQKHIDGETIILSKNFRSRLEVLNNINTIFSSLMTKEIGGVSFIDNQQMVYGNLGYQANNLPYNHNLEILKYLNEEKKFTNGEIEAFIIAKDIQKKLNDCYSVYDFDKQTIRHATYSDFCIILDRGTDMPMIKKVFEYFNIPLEIYKDSNLTSDIEILLIKNIIGLILQIYKKEYNQQMNYYFTSIARSYLSDLNDNDIYHIIKDKKIFNTSIYQICQELALQLDTYTPNSLVRNIIKKFHIYENLIKVGNVKETMIRYDYILKLTMNMETLGFSIIDFKEYLENILKEGLEIKYQEAKENRNCVKIMNIHKSKGLEFPICYFAGFTKEFNFKELNNRFLVDSTYGILTPFYEEGIGSLFTKTLIKNQYKKEEVSEKMRLFYVALTRCKEKMIIVLPEFKEELIIKQQVDYLTGINFKSFYQFMNAISLNLKDYMYSIDIDSLALTHDYEFSKSQAKEYWEENQKIEMIDLQIQENIQQESHASKTIHSILSYEENQTLEFGTKMHEMLEQTDFKHYQGNNPYIKKLLDTFDFKNANIYQELEFYFETDKNEFHGIIDLMLEYIDHISIIDYKLKNIDDEEYQKQLNIYYDYVSSVSDKPIKLYLYSILDNRVKEIEVVKS